MPHRGATGGALDGARESTSELSTNSSPGAIETATWSSSSSSPSVYSSCLALDLPFERVGLTVEEPDCFSDEDCSGFIVGGSSSGSISASAVRS